MKKLLAVIIFLILLSFLFIKQPWVNNKDEALVEDLVYVKEHLPKEHVNLFVNIDEEYFNNKMDYMIELSREGASDDDVIFELNKLIAEIGDSHTQINYEISEWLPIRIRKFEDNNYYIIKTTEQNKEILNNRILSINGVSIENIIEKFETVIPHESQYSFDMYFTIFLMKLYFLRNLDIVTDDNKIILEVQDDEQIYEYEINILKIDNSSLPSVFVGDNGENFITKNSNGNHYWSKVINENQLYINYNSCIESKDISMVEFTNNVQEEINSNNIEKIIIDLRYNSGGNSKVINPLIEELQKYNFNKGIYVLINGDTYSSGMMNALQLKNIFDATLVGEPTGQKLNHFGYVKYLDLPNNSFEISYSTQYFNLIPNSDVDALYPDIPIQYTFEDYINGTDSALEYVIEE